MYIKNHKKNKNETKQVVKHHTYTHTHKVKGEQKKITLRVTKKIDKFMTTHTI